MVKKTKKKESKAKKISVSKNKSSGEAKKLITKEMLIGDIAMKYPVSVPIMFKFGMHCIGCGMTAYESLEQGCMAHGMSEQGIDKMVGEMNKEISKTAKKK